MDFKGLSDPVVILSNKPEKKSIFDKLRPPSTNFMKGKYISAGLTVFLLFAVGLGVFISQKPTQLKPQADSNVSNPLLLSATASCVQNSPSILLKWQGGPSNATWIHLDKLPQGQESQWISDPSIGYSGSVRAPATEGSIFNPDPNGLGHLELNTTYVVKVRVQIGENELPGTVISDGSNQITVSTPVSCDSANTNFCTADSDCPSGFFCPQLPQSSGLAVDRVCTQGTAPSPSPSPSPSISPSASPTASPSASPSSSPSASPSPSPSPSLSPSPSPSANASPSPSPLPSNFPRGKGGGNNDGVVDLADLSILLSNWSPAINITSHYELDFDNNLRINSIDRAYMVELLISLGIISR